MEIRARTMTRVKVASYKVYRSLTDKYISKMRAMVAGMRVPIGSWF